MYENNESRDMFQQEAKNMESKELVSREDASQFGGLAPAEVLAGGHASYWCSITDDGTRDTKIKILQAMDDADFALQDRLGEVIEVEHIMAHSIVFKGDDGRAQQAIRTILITPDGTRYACVSDGVVQSLRNIIGTIGAPPFDPPLKVAPKLVKTRQGYRTLKLEPVI